MTVLTKKQTNAYSQFHIAIQDQVSDRKKAKMAYWTRIIAPKHRLLISGAVNKKGKLIDYQLLRNWEPVISGLSWKELKLIIKILKLL